MQIFGLVLEPVSRRLGRRGSAWAFLFPNMAFFSVFQLLPIFLLAYYSLSSGSSIFATGREFVGGENFSQILRCEDYFNPNSCNADLFWRGVWNTLGYVFFEVGALMLLSLATALVLNQRIRGRGFFRSVFFYPVLLSPVIVALVWKWILQDEGLLNAALDGLSVPTVNWLLDANWSRYFVIAAGVWATLGFYTLIILAGLQGINPQLYDAARVDGAKDWQRFLDITLPLLRPSLLVAFMLAFIRAVQASRWWRKIMIAEFLGRRHGKLRPTWRDLIVYAYLALGVTLMLGPVLWAAVSSLKTEDSIRQYPPEFVPQTEAVVEVDGYDAPLPVYRVTLDNGEERLLAQASRVGIMARMVDPENPETTFEVPLSTAEAVRTPHLAFNNYVEPLRRFNFSTFFGNSIFVTIAATMVTLLITSMAAFALSKYKFRGRNVVLGLIASQLLIPGTVLLVPTFIVVSWLGWFNSYHALIWPLVATPTGVFLLRQYMLTIPDDMLDAARVDGASEWRVYWETVLPLTAPALSVLAIFSVMWRWNDFIWPLIVISDSDKFTLPLALTRLSGQYTTSWGQLLAMTVLSLLPITIIFAFLQRFITTGIASMGVKG
eukprot:jgi/Tetstr1/451935/TSEL_038971.t1